MVKDPNALKDLQEAWGGVRLMVKRMQQVVTGAFAFGGYPSSATGVLYNLPLLLACDVLGQVLAQLRTEGVFACKSAHPGPLMDTAKDALPWQDWQAVRATVKRRNSIAHDGALFEGKPCIADIERIEAQLKAWDIVT